MIFVVATEPLLDKLHNCDHIECCQDFLYSERFIAPYLAFGRSWPIGI